MTEFTKEFIEFHKLCLEQYIGTEEFVWSVELALDTLNEIERLQKVIEDAESFGANMQLASRGYDKRPTKGGVA